VRIALCPFFWKEAAMRKAYASRALPSGTIVTDRRQAISYTATAVYLPLSAVTLEKARQLLKVHADFGGYYNAHGAKLVLAEVTREHGQAAADALVRELDLERIFSIKPANGT
jgi:hypothetical protein